MRSIVLAVLISFLAAVPGAAISPYLVRDISQVHRPIDSNPEQFVSIGPLALFCAGREGDLWASDGTAAGTRMLQPGLVGRPLAVAGDTAYFLSFLDGSPFALWSSRGTSATTQRLGEFSTLVLPGTRVVTVPGGRSIFFTARDDSHGGELWTSDGTPGGTRLVIDLRPGDRSGEIAELTWFKGRLYFTGDDGRGFGLWSTDGTAAGTRRIRAFTVPTASALFLRALPNRLVYFGPERASGYELWTSDGTAAGTVPLPEIAAGGRSADPRDAIVVGNRYYTIASDGRTGRDLWTTDGTARGTRVLTRLPPADPFDSSFLVFHFYQLPNRLVFYADDGIHGREPWVSDGTVAGTKLLADLCPGSCASTSGTLPSLPNRLLIGAITPATGAEIWSTDGTPAGTRLTKDICPGICWSNYYGFHRLGGRILFAAREPTHGEQLWATDGTSAGTARVSNLPHTMPFGGFFPAAVAGGKLLFPGSDFVHGRELWATRGRLGSTRWVADLEPGESELSGSFPTAFTSAGSRAYFFADDGFHGYELWSSDGSAAGTKIASHLVAGADPIHPPSNLRTAGADGRLFFTASIDGSGDSLLIADGSPGGLVPVSLDPMQRVGELEIVAGRLYFATSDPTVGLATLWRTDWTGVPRTAVATSGGISWLHDFGDDLLFAREGAEEERGLWHDEAAAGSPRRLAEVTPESEPALFAGRLWFFGRTSEGDRGVWATDGTEEGTEKKLDVASVFAITKTPLAGGTSTLYLFGEGEAGLGLYATEGTPDTLRFLGSLGPRDVSSRKDPVVLGNRLFFESAHPNEPVERVLWSSDGTLAGTAPLRDGSNGLLFNPVYLQIFGGKVVGFLFHSWFESDGSSSGTRIFTTPDSDLANLGAPAQAAGRLFFTGTSRELGTELWALAP